MITNNLHLLAKHKKAIGEIYSQTSGQILYIVSTPPPRGESADANNVQQVTKMNTTTAMLTKTSGEKLDEVMEKAKSLTEPLITQYMYANYMLSVCRDAYNLLDITPEEAKEICTTAELKVIELPLFPCHADSNGDRIENAKWNTFNFLLLQVKN